MLTTYARAMIDVEALLAATFPGFATRTVETLGEGWDHVAYLVNGELVFRLPWAVIEETGPPPGAAGEIAVLRAVAGRLPVTSPEPSHVAPGDVWFGYPFLPGEPVQGKPLPDGFAALVTDTILSIEQVVPADIGIPVRDCPADEEALVASLYGRGVVPPAIDELAGEALRTRASRWPAAAARRLAVLHADLGLDHWLVDHDDGSVALIAWSDAAVGPPETQLRTLMWDEPALAAEVIARYQDTTGSAVDVDLVFADGILQAYTDLAELLAEGEDLEIPLAFLHRWSDLRADGLRMPDR